MIEPYNLDNSEFNIILNNIMENTFIFLVILITIWIFISLVIWFMGAKIKSEKTIKFGVKNFMLSIGVQIFILLIPCLIALIK